MWRLPPHIFKAWIAILTHKDHESHTWRGNEYTLSDTAKITVPEAAESLAILSAADPASLSKEHDGKRILSDDGEHWFVVNGEKYQEMIQREIARENARNRTAKWRAKKKGKKPDIEDQEGPIPDPLEVPENLKTQPFMNAWQRWMTVRRGMKKVKDWVAFFRTQLDWLADMGPEMATESLNNSIRNNYMGLFDPRDKRNGNGGSARVLRGGKMIQAGEKF